MEGREWIGSGRGTTGRVSGREKGLVGEGSNGVGEVGTEVGDGDGVGSGDFKRGRLVGGCDGVEEGLWVERSRRW